MSGQSAQGTDARTRMLKVAADLFHKQGVIATSPDQVIEASDTGKGQFYHYFGSKEGLVHQVLQSYLEAIKSGASQIDYTIDSWQDLERWFAAHVEMQKTFGMTRGCPFGTIGNEVTENDELIRQDLCLLFEVVKSKLATFFIKEKSKGRLPRSARPEEMAEFCIAAVQGAMLMGRIKRDSGVVETTLQASLAALRTKAALRGGPRDRARR